MSALASSRFRFEPPVSAEAVRRALEHEVGRARASERAIDIGDRDGVVTIESMDAVAFAYATKVCLRLGGVPSRPRERPLPAWTDTPWVRLPWWRRLRLWIGPTPF